MSLPASARYQFSAAGEPARFLAHRVHVEGGPVADRAQHRPQAAPASSSRSAIGERNSRTYANRARCEGRTRMASWIAFGMRHRDRGERAHPLRVQRGQHPADLRAPVVAEHVRPLDAERVEHGNRVRDRLGDPVAGHLGGPGAGRVAALVEGVRAQAGGVQPGQQEIELAVVLRKAVQQQHRLAVGRPALEHVEGEPARLDLHVITPSLSRQHRQC